MDDFTDTVLVGGFGLGFVLPISELVAGIPLDTKNMLLHAEGLS